MVKSRFDRFIWGRFVFFVFVFSSQLYVLSAHFNDFRHRNLFQMTCFLWALCLCDKYSDKNNLGEKRLVWLSIPGHSPSSWRGQGGRNLKQSVISHPLSGAESKEPARVPHAYTFQNPLPRGWCHSQRVNLPTLINMIEIIPCNKPIGQPNLDHPSLSLLEWF